MDENSKLQKGLLKGVENAYQLIVEHLVENEKTTITDTVLVMMTKNIIERVKTIQILSEMNREESITILTRAFLELQVSLIFILQKNTNERAQSYYYNNKIQTAKNLISMQKTNPKYDLTLNKKEIEELKKDIPEANSIQDYIYLYEEKWYKMFSPYKSKGKKRLYRKWYALEWEHTSFKDMMRSIGVEEELYHFFYGITSIDSHGMGAVKNIKINQDVYKITGALPSYLCYAVIESYLCNVIFELSDYYGLTEEEELISAFKMIANSTMV